MPSTVTEELVALSTDTSWEDSDTERDALGANGTVLYFKMGVDI